MFSNIKQGLRRRLWGRRMYQRLMDDQRTIGLLGNLHYHEHHPELAPPGSIQLLHSYEFSCYSQNGEDGIILFLLSRIKPENYCIVEIGTEDGKECNSANLILNFGWSACLIETDVEMTRMAERYFSDCNVGDRVQVLNQHVTPENVNQLLKEAGIPRATDVLSIDIDSYDYWLWEAMETIEPRLVVIEYNASFGPSLSVTIPPHKPLPSSGVQAKYYHGASISALYRLGKRKGYDLIGCDRKGVNAFFVRSELATSAQLRPLMPEQAFQPHFKRTQKKSLEQQLEIIKGFELTEIE